MGDTPERREPPYTVAKLAEHWGCSYGKVWDLVRSEQLPSFRLGKLHRIRGDVVAKCPTLASVDVVYPLGRLPNAATKEFMKAIANTIAAYPGDGGFIYFMRCREIVKIGYSREPAQRHAVIQMGIPFEVELIGFVPGSLQAEKALHAALKAIKFPRQAEWFNLNDDLLSAIQRITKSEGEGHG